MLTGLFCQEDLLDVHQKYPAIVTQMYELMCSFFGMKSCHKFELSLTF